jgi:hypothetical protein
MMTTETMSRFTARQINRDLSALEKVRALAPLDNLSARLREMADCLEASLRVDLPLFTRLQGLSNASRLDGLLQPSWESGAMPAALRATYVDLTGILQRSLRVLAGVL